MLQHEMMLKAQKSNESHKFIRRLVSGLRDYEEPPPVKVYNAKTKELIRIEYPNKN